MAWRARRLLTVSAAVSLGIAVHALASVPASAQEAGSAGVATQRGDGANEGIHVHGHWVIEVRAPDGETVSRHEFENALLADGMVRMTRILTRELTTFYWRISVSGGDQPCHNDQGTPQACFIYEPGQSLGASNQSDNLSAAKSGDEMQIILTGSVTANDDGVVTTVGTQLGPSNINMFAFTGATQDAAGNPLSIAVANGQTVMVTVTLSFS